jgi:Mn-containing catalase
MFKHEKMLFHPVEIEKPNPQYAALLQEQLGGGNGELKAAKMYFSMSDPGPNAFATGEVKPVSFDK